ncbi:tigger transposable element-derived protein 7-like [Eriocheir sinensis]|uniref:tigger transposable element-derived protein 7-like n=1 Tax=Eriocheir sinensis TaxID=95602 RepID=UPI0021C78A66|nr:tigger transposable element-derived protein 7-like [Eriocheir sinensis]
MMVGLVYLGGPGESAGWLKPVVVGKNRKPRGLKDIMTKLPVEYHESASAWFNQDVTTNWFHRSFDPSGVIESVKRHYRNLYLQQCLVVVEDGMDEPDYVDTRRRKTIENFNDYKIKDAIFNLAEAWQQVPLATLRHAWCKLLKTPKIPSLGRKEFEGLEIPRIVKMLQEAGQGEFQPEELVEWAEEDFGVPGYHHLTEEEIASSVQGGETTAEEKEEDEEERTAQGPSLAAGLESIATCLSLIDRVGKPLANHYEGLRVLRRQVIQLQQAKLKVGSEAGRKETQEPETSLWRMVLVRLHESC